MILYTSDTHYGHFNILKYSKRPFSNIHEMDEALINNWNNIVTPDDHVYHLGDFGFCSPYNLQRIFDRLMGHKHLIKGNHDKQATFRLGWESVNNYKEITDGKDKVILFHYSCRVWNKSHHGSLMLYGHSHGNLPGNDQSLDVGVDCFNYTPVTLEQIKERMKLLPKYSSGDHHKRND